MWAGIMFDGHTDLHIFDGDTVNVRRYRDKILEPYLQLFRGGIGPHLMCMEDNARSIRVHLLDDYLKREDIQHMDWSTLSADMNPLEQSPPTDYTLEHMYKP